MKNKLFALFSLLLFPFASMAQFTMFSAVPSGTVGKMGYGTVTHVLDITVSSVSDLKSNLLPYLEVDQDGSLIQSTSLGRGTWIILEVKKDAKGMDIAVPVYDQKFLRQDNDVLNINILVPKNEYRRFILAFVLRDAEPASYLDLNFKGQIGTEVKNAFVPLETDDLLWGDMTLFPDPAFDWNKQVVYYHTKPIQQLARFFGYTFAFDQYGSLDIFGNVKVSTITNPTFRIYYGKGPGVTQKAPPWNAIGAFQLRTSTGKYFIDSNRKATLYTSRVWDSGLGYTLVTIYGKLNIEHNLDPVTFMPTTVFYLYGRVGATMVKGGNFTVGFIPADQGIVNTTLDRVDQFLSQGNTMVVAPVRTVR